MILKLLWIAIWGCGKILSGKYGIRIISVGGHCENYPLKGVYSRMSASFVIVQHITRSEYILQDTLILLMLNAKVSFEVSTIPPYPV